MTEFSERDLNRSWSAGELAQLSERDLTKLAFRRALKNAAFFVPVAVVVGLIVGTLGLAGKVIGWFAIVGFAAFALEPLAGFATGVVALVGVAAGKYPTGRSGVSWRLLQLLVALANAALYAGLAAWVYTRMRA
ncbi:MAG TPA: hypothetical protein VI837_03970 [Blastocatellia bacterium]|nr:hypothetical protein [Blastocatellia bacterium]